MRVWNDRAHFLGEERKPAVCVRDRDEPVTVGNGKERLDGEQDLLDAEDRAPLLRHLLLQVELVFNGLVKNRNAHLNARTTTRG